MQSLVVIMETECQSSCSNQGNMQLFLFFFFFALVVRNA